MPWNLVTFASTEAAEDTSLLGSLGIDVQLLVVQSIAFLLLLFVLGKYAFPVLNRMLEKREALIEESVRAAHDAEKNAKIAEEKTAKLMKQARVQADEVLASAKTEAVNIVTAAEAKSRERSERMVAEAKAEVEKDIADARKVLRRETLELVAEATEQVVGKTVNATVDKRIVEQAVSEAKS